MTTAAAVDGGSAAGVGPRVSEVVLPGSGQRLRESTGVLSPQDVPLWMTRGGATARSAVAALAADAGVVRRVRDTLHAVLVDTASALGWRGSAAQAAELGARVTHGTLAAVVTQVDAAQTALNGLAAALDAQHAVLGSASSSWARTTGVDQQQVLVRQWQPAVQALDAADARAAEALHQATSELVRLGRTAQSVGWLGDVFGGRSRVSAADDGASGSGLADDVGRSVGRVFADAVNGLASTANAAGQHPEAALELVAGLFLMDVGASGEFAGLALDATGVGAVAGVPVNAAAAGVIGTGAGLAVAGGSTIWFNAAGDDRVTPLKGGGSPFTPEEMEQANYAQKDCSGRFSVRGTFKGATIDSVAARLRVGSLKPEDVPIDAIRRDGKVLILNTRSSVALQKAGIPRSRWKWVNRTGNRGYERRLNGQLDNNLLDSNGSSEVLVKDWR